MVCFSATEKINQRVQEKMRVWEQTRNLLKEGVEDLKNQFKEDCQSLEVAAFKLDEMMTGKPDMPTVQLGKIKIII